MKALITVIFFLSFVFVSAKDQTNYVTGQQEWEMHLVEGNKVPVQDKDVFATVYYVDDTAMVASFTNLAAKGASVTIVLSNTAYSGRNLWNKCMKQGCKVYWNKVDLMDNVAIFSYKHLELPEGKNKKAYLLATAKFYTYLARAERIN